jgi:excisionase family DNA binding protein
MDQKDKQRFEPLLLRGAEVAQVIGCSRAMAYLLMKRGDIPVIRMPRGKSVRVPREALVEWIKEHTRTRRTDE